ncbi:MAG: NTP transferase domain-containing protein [Oscillospiraceae bacterium]|nr:NTP transferase domain-containing protein [Oscillospiraceae bacterium]
MKAIILAGGEGTRLRPLSLMKPKPMIRLFDRPLLEHIVLLLQRNGFTELCMTLHYLPQVIRDYFGDGGDLGVSIEYRTETEAAGTAGSVLACRDFIGDEDFLVISGDAACSYDLRAMMEKHRLSGADATILVRKSREASEFGLVLPDENGRVHSFVEKPGPERVVSDLINTGVYVLSPAVLKEIPRGRSVDFGGEVFPRMLRGRHHIHAWQAEGYWNDVGSCQAYLATCRDVLDGRFPLPIPEGRTIRASGPCWVSPEALVSERAEVGPYTVIGRGSTVEGACRLSGCVVDGAYLQTGSTAEDSILSCGVRLGRGVQLRSGCVLAEGVTVGGGSLLTENLRVWPGLTLPAGSVLTEDQRSGADAAPLRFREGGLIRGENGAELTPERILRLGRGCGAGRVVAAAVGGSYARLLAEAFLLGAGAAGKRTFLADAPTASAAAAAGSIYGMDQCLFFHQKGDKTTIRFFDGDGLPLERKEQRKMESALGGAVPASNTEASHTFALLTGTEEAYLASVLRAGASLGGVRIVSSPGLLQKALLLAGAELCPSGNGTAELRLSEDGFTLCGVDERGREWPWDMLLCALTAAELRCGVQAVALPYEAPLLAERIAREENGTVYRLERDGEDARRLRRAAPWFRDGLTLALRLLSRLRELGTAENLAGFMDTLPEYHSFTQVVRLDGPDTAVLRQLSRDPEAETVNGVRLHRGEASAIVRRLGGGEVRILAESCKMEAAAEFCDSLQRRIRELDKG